MLKKLIGVTVLLGILVVLGFLGYGLIMIIARLIIYLPIIILIFGVN